jgi:uncharacterized protein (DUF1778 family)
MGTRINSVPLGLRISQDADDLLEKLAAQLGTSKTSIIEGSIRQRAKEEGIEVIESWRKPISVAKVKTKADFLKFEKKIAAFGHTGSLAPSADSREAIYGDRG